VAKQQGDYPTASVRYRLGLSMRRELGDKSGIAASLNNLGVIAYELTDFAAARALYGECVPILRELDARGTLATVLGNLAIVAAALGDAEAARTTCEESLAIMRELGDQNGISRSLNNLGDLAYDRGDQKEARALFAENLSIARTLGDKHAIAYALEGMAASALALGAPLRAARVWGAAERLRQEIGSALPRNERPRYDRRVAGARAVAGASAFDRSWQEGRALTLDQAMALASNNDFVHFDETGSTHGAAQRLDP
jgi:tetratricopeptide (TPR) repeat protein